jgi:hypothetical protein
MNYSKIIVLNCPEVAPTQTLLLLHAGQPPHLSLCPPHTCTHSYAHSYIHSDTLILRCTLTPTHTHLFTSTFIHVLTHIHTHTHTHPYTHNALAVSSPLNWEHQMVLSMAQWPSLFPIKLLLLTPTTADTSLMEAFCSFHFSGSWLHPCFRCLPLLLCMLSLFISVEIPWLSLSSLWPETCWVQHQLLRGSNERI